MEILKVIIFEYILGHFLQCLTVVLGIYTFNRQKIIFKNYLLVTSFLTLLSCLVRLLPITLGVHIIINMLFTYLICVILLKMPAYTTIRSTSLCVIIILVCEMIVTGIVMLALGKERFEILINNTVKRVYIGVMANVMFALVVTLSYYLLMKKGDKHRNISSQDS